MIKFRLSESFTPLLDGRNRVLRKVRKTARESVIRVVDPATQAEEKIKARENVKVGGTE